MKFDALPIDGAWLITANPIDDARGSFTCLYQARAFADHGLNTRWVQTNQAFNRYKGILRGMHRQRAPHGEIKLVMCLQGAVYDVILDLRPDSPTYRRWTAVELAGDSARMVYVPEGCAHGYQTLTETAVVSYSVSAEYAPHAEAGVRWDDPAFGIAWPDVEQRLLSPKDQAWPDYVGEPVAAG